MPARHKPRQGVLLLVVLSILVLFVLLATTFIVVVAGHYRRVAQVTSVREQTGDRPGHLLDRAMHQLLRDTRNTQSSLLHHSLLADLYGNDGFTGHVLNIDRNVSRITQNQFDGFRIDVDRFRGPRRAEDYYNGAVITMVSGRAQGLSARIIRSPTIPGTGDGGELQFITEAFLSDHNEIVQLAPGDRFLVNGIPLNGTGMGYDPNTGKLDLSEDQGRRVALLPHFRTYTRPTPVDVGGADESYDAVDPQNMFLAKVPAGASTGEEIITPSFHRPHLISYWLSQLGEGVSPDVLRTLLRQIVMRPTALDHPDFTGSNPALALGAEEGVESFIETLRTGPWDVDNDGDGVPDSVWLDLGQPASTAPDGRLYRPLFAILCTDLDGRLNVNVHGNLAQLEREFIAPVQPERMVASDGAVQVPRGLGTGPAEVNLEAIFGRVESKDLLLDRYTDTLRREDFPQPGIQRADDRLSRLKSAMVPPDYRYNQQLRFASTQPSLLHAFSSPPDVHGRGAVVLDHAGQPLFIGMGAANETIDDPYELNVLQPSGADSPFAVSDLERVLRPNDGDSGLLPSRLLRLAPSTLASSPDGWRNRRAITTHSFHVPVPAVQLPTSDMRIDFGSSATIVQWMRQRLEHNGVPNVPHQLRLMLPFEIRHGQKMDLNRLWSDKRDGQHDEFGRPGSGQRTVESAVSILSSSDSMPIDYLNDDVATPGRYAQTRQMFARQLYCLTMLLLPPAYTDPTIQLENAPNGSQQAAELTARRIAQWAVNVVDFRDPDAIMTPFEYDWNPRNGWQEDIDGDLNSSESGDRRVVWGCEYPHLLLTETLALHDTRLKDSEWDTDEGQKRDQNNDGTSNPEEPDGEDDDLDQYRIPQGSFFAELYCTFDVNNRRPDAATRIAPPELYRLDQTDGLWKLDLGRVPTERRRDGGVYPTWRLAITEPHRQQESVLARLQSKPETTTLQPEAMDFFSPAEFAIDRVIWFTTKPPTLSTFQFGRIYWNYRSPAMPTQVAGKQYAVVGPRAKTFIGSKPSTEDTTRSQPSDRMIFLDLQPGGNKFGVSTGFPSSVRPAIGVVVAMPPPSSWSRPDATAPEGIGASISEPLPSGLPGEEYYPEPAHRIDDPSAFPITDAYGIEGITPEKLPDVPLDREDNRPVSELNLAEGTHENYRTVFLQRLPNPLRAWNPSPGHTHHDPELPVNPYITVDWMPVDLTVFNGESTGPPPGWDQDWNWPDEMVQQTEFSTRERGNRDLAARPDPFAWNIAPLRRSNDVVDQTNYFHDGLAHTLGFLNTTYGPWRANGEHYRGDPRRPFPWLTWNDRPFSNANELMLVPASSPSRFMIEYTTNTRKSPYTGGVDNLRAPYPHLLNFFHSSRTGATSPNLCRLLELVEVPSPFVGTERWYNPRFFVRDASDNSLSVRDQATYTFRPPFNKLARFRDPGRVNLNTIFDERVWKAIAWGFPNKSEHTFWQKLVRSRRGYAQGEQDRYPTEFANPFRSALGADLQFELMRNRLVDRPDVEATILRSSPANRSKPLFEYQSNSMYDNTDQNPYFRYQFLRRLGNIASTHSNVFAVWITLGYFEIDPRTGLLGQELNADTGGIKRHRAFYLIDRSIPVAYEPDRNHNVDRAVLLRRFIE